VPRPAGRTRILAVLALALLLVALVVLVRDVPTP
jgi:hypothetical protein